MDVFEAQPEYFSSIQMLKRSSAASAGHCGYMSLSIHIEIAITFDPRVNITDQRWVGSMSREDSIFRIAILPDSTTVGPRIMPVDQQPQNELDEI